MRAALTIQRALAELNERNVRSGVPNELTARIGIDAGPVVVDAGGRGSLATRSPLLARVQALAEPGTVLITARVQRQTAGLFVAEGPRRPHVRSCAPEPKRRPSESCARAVRPCAPARP